MNASGRERGQALVLIILAIVGMFGFAALAVDGGRVYAERRRAQSAADTAAYAAAYAASEGINFTNRALDQAGLNGFLDPNPNVAGDRTDIEVYHPPVDGPYTEANVGATLANQYYQVKIHAQVDQVFSQFVYRGPLLVQVEAVSRLTATAPVSGGNAIVATTPDACKGVWFHGNGDTVVTGGNIFSNSDADASLGGPAMCYSILQGGNGDVTINDGAFVTPGEFFDDTGTGTVTPDPDYGVNGYINDAEHIVVPDIDVPDCENLQPERSYGGGSADLLSGYYPDGIQVHGNNSVLNLSQGVYCLDDDLTMNGGEINGIGVVFIIRNGDFIIGGDTEVHLKSPTDIYFNNIQWGGMLLFMPINNDGAVHIGGGSGSTYSGTIFAPGPRTPESQDKCVIEGSGTSIGVNSSIYCYNVKIGGNATVSIEYQADRNFHLPPYISLAE